MESAEGTYLEEFISSVEVRACVRAGGLVLCAASPACMHHSGACEVKYDLCCITQSLWRLLHVTACRTGRTGQVP